MNPILNSFIICSLILLLSNCAQDNSQLFTQFDRQASFIPKSQITIQQSDLPTDGTQGTQGYYLSPHALGKQVEVERTLRHIVSKIVIQKIQYNHSESTYIMDNFAIELDYNDGKQKVQIGDLETVTVTNGTIFFGYRFNYSIHNKQKNVNGWAHGNCLFYLKGSVYSDGLTYKKHLIVNNEGYLEWALPKIDAYTQLKITNRMGIKRMEPYNETDYTILQQMLDRAFQNISPSNFETQLLTIFNKEFFPALNDSLNHEIFGHQIKYSYHHPSKGLLNMTMFHKLHGLSVNKTDGFKIIFVTEIEGHENDTTCNMTVPDIHSSFDLYGGVQNIHLNCLYQDVVNFVQAQGWLDTKLNQEWQVPAFQFYAGDLFDLMNNLYTKVLPQSLLSGECKANKNNLLLKQSRDYQANTYRLSVQYNCSVKTTTKTGDQLDILQFVAQTRLYIKAEADQHSLNFEIVDADVMYLSFTPVNNFIVTNMNLALFKATQVLKKNLHSRVFGSGFPSLPRQSPRTRVDTDTVIYYDASAVGMQFENKNNKQFLEM